MIKATNIHKYFAGIHAVKGVDLTVRDGEVLCVIGPSGSGKSTLLRCLNMLEKPDEGTVEVDGVAVSEENIREMRTRMAMVFQNFNLFSHMTALENITVAPVHVKGMSKEEAAEKGLDLLRLVGLEDKADAYPRQLSGGQKQRVALARTMVMKPKILLLDEPLSALDGVIKESIKDRIKTIAQEYNLTTIIVTHDPEEALTLSDRVMIINEGVIAQYGKPEEIIQRPENGFVRKFILNQLEIKRNNIYTLFAGQLREQAQVC